MVPPNMLSPAVAIEPFAVCALPTPHDVSDELLHAAYAAMLALFPKGCIAERITGGLEEARARHAWQFSDGAIRTRSQTVKLAQSGEDMLCSCPDWKFKRTLHHGMCRHVCAVELVRMAQARDAHTRHTVIADIAIAPPVLRAVLTCAIASVQNQEYVTFAFKQNTLELTTDALALTLCCDGYGACHQTLQTEHLADLVTHLATTDDDSILIQITPTHLDVLGSTLEVSIPVA
jgi:hypothetical protein